MDKIDGFTPRINMLGIAWRTKSPTGLEFSKPVSIGDDVWVGGSVIICPGVSIGDRSLVLEVLSQKISPPEY